MQVARHWSFNPRSSPSRGPMLGDALQIGARASGTRVCAGNGVERSETRKHAGLSCRVGALLLRPTPYCIVITAGSSPCPLAARRSIRPGWAARLCGASGLVCMWEAGSLPASCPDVSRFTTTLWIGSATACASAPKVGGALKGLLLICVDATALTWSGTPEFNSADLLPRTRLASALPPPSAPLWEAGGT